MFRGPRFLNDVFSEKISIFADKTSDDLVFSRRSGFSDFPFLFPDSPYLYYVKCCICPFAHKKTHYFRTEFLYDIFFTLFVLSRASDNTTSQNIGGTMHGPCPTSNLGGTVPLVLPRSPPLPRSE